MGLQGLQPHGYWGHNQQVYRKHYFIAEIVNINSQGARLANICIIGREGGCLALFRG